MGGKKYLMPFWFCTFVRPLRKTLLIVVLGGKTLVGNHRCQTFLVVGHQVCSHLKRDFVPLLGARNLADWYGIKYLFDSLKCKWICNFFFKICFSGFCCCYSVSHYSNKLTLKMIDWSFLCQWANAQNQLWIHFFPPLYTHIANTVCHNLTLY